jgi:hypothetical protein
MIASCFFRGSFNLSVCKALSHILLSVCGVDWIRRIKCGEVAYFETCEIWDQRIQFGDVPYSMVQAIKSRRVFYLVFTVLHRWNHREAIQ